MVIEIHCTNCAENPRVSMVRYDRIGSRFSGTTSKHSDCHGDTLFGQRMGSVYFNGTIRPNRFEVLRYHLKGQALATEMPYFDYGRDSVLSRWQTVSRWSLPTRYHHLEDSQIPQRYCVFNALYNRCISMVHHDPIVSSSEDITLESYECHGGVTSFYCNNESTSERTDSEETQVGERRDSYIQVIDQRQR
jgi:hypothetical protein